MLIGKRLGGRYKIIKMIGGGGMANVYLAQDMILEREVALKVLRLDFVNEEEFLRRFQREAQSATSLVHPHIVNIYDVGEEEGINYIVMEYVDGMTLKQYIQQYSPIPVEKTIDIMKQLASAIAFAHHNSIIHRDIKPHNILMDRDGNVKITDFGIAMALSATSITQTNAVLGSVHYISPEQARGGMATKKSDIYALGIVMFELLTGQLPFSGESAVSVALKHLQVETPSVKRWNPAIPQSVENIVLKATAKDPFHRYASLEEMEQDLSTTLDPERANEEKFSIQEDDEKTKAIPVITDGQLSEGLDTKIVRPADPKDEPQEKVKEKKKRKRWPIVVLVSVLLIVLAVAAAILVPALLGPKEIKVPDVSGKQLDEAVSKLVTDGFKVGKTKKRFSDEVPEGVVIKTAPAAGRTIQEGDTVNIYMSSGKETISFADYRGKSFAEANEELEKAGFKSIEQKTTHDESEAGTILDQDPEPENKVVPEETTVTFTVSGGPEKISLIDLKDYNEKSLKDYAESTGLNIVIVREDYSDSVAKGLVMSQKPSSGTALNKGDTVQVAISKGKKEIPPKTVTKEITIPYEPEEEGKPQEVQIYIEDMNHSMTEPFEVLTIQEDLKKTLEFVLTKDSKAGYKVIRDQRVIIDETIPYPDETEDVQAEAADDADSEE
ncbi:Stk1 family PASTA domain-containing Ser/Thr kinase [Pseudobacillus wudalianchiensis]|uniref:Serine/threonine-protein kinase PrkC n=1 Tax=Pseudobacillus wudalianchiensis TaxID=1743143 RepID=A0A1B9AJ87_9BACI|nr:Stk1 family PASTA domain-containing Ser/Thr kinase [Bacillus wudalianchiensis]OCA83877.1 serine/threonine protein kinase [Bacillus wudalianchiensis]